MRVLVTGGAGFIGAYLIPILLSRGYEVNVFDAAERPSSLADSVGYVRGDLGAQADVYRAMMACRPEGVFHLGAILAGPCEENPQRGFAVNFGSTQVLLDASVALGVRRFFLVSSISVFGRDAPQPVADDAVKNPETVYGQTKLASEHLIQWYARRHGIETVALRFTWVFGPGRTTGITATYSSLVLDAIARGKPIVISNPDERGDWLYVKDAVKAILAAWDARDLTQRVFNIAGGVHSIRKVVEIARNMRPDARVELMAGGSSLSPYPVAYDDSAARRALGFRPDYSIEAAVAEHLRTVAST
jgi:UDP-glucose 4-epimerase